MTLTKKLLCFAGISGLALAYWSLRSISQDPHLSKPAAISALSNDTHQDTALLSEQGMRSESLASVPNSQPLNLQTLLLEQPVSSLNRRIIQEALTLNPEQLFEFLSKKPELDQYDIRILLDVIYQFDDVYRLRAAQEFLYGDDPDYRYAGYQLLAAADSETPDENDYYIQVLLDASYTEQDPNNLLSVMTLLADETLTPEVNELAKRRAELLLDDQAAEVKAEALRFLLKTSPNDPNLQAQLNENLLSEDLSLVLPAMQTLYRVEQPSEAILSTLQGLKQQYPHTTTGKEAAPLLHHYGL